MPNSSPASSTTITANALARRFTRILTLFVAALLIVGLTSPSQAAPKEHKVTAKLSKTSVTAGKSVTISGKVSPAAPGKKVTIQLKKTGSKKWKTVKKVKLNSKSKYKYKFKTKTSSAGAYRVVKPKSAKVKKGVSKTRTLKVKKAKKDNKKETTSQKNARLMAKDYLDLMAFSRKGLISQLKFEGFSQKDAEYGVDALKVNWKKQAVRMAKEYLDVMPFSRKGLIDQLIFEGFSRSHAEYAADKVGL